MNYTAKGGDWNVPSTWTPSGIPGPDDNVTIPGDVFVIIPVGHLVTVGQSGVLNVGGGDGGYIMIKGTLVNNGSIILNNGTLQNYPGALLENNGTITGSAGDCSIVTQGTLNNNQGGTIANRYHVDNWGPGGLAPTGSGVLTNYGTINNASSITNGGTIINKGTVNNDSGGSISNTDGRNNPGTIDNYGTVTFNGGGFSWAGAPAISDIYSGHLNSSPPSAFNMEPGSTVALGSGTTVTVLGNTADPWDTYPAVLPSGAQLVVQEGAVLSIPAPGTLSAFGTLYNSGTIETLDGPGAASLNIMQSGALYNNNGVLTSSGGVFTGKSGVINNAGSIANYGTGANGAHRPIGFPIPVSPLTIAAVINNSGTFSNFGTFTNYGTFNIPPGGNLTNRGTFHTDSGKLTYVYGFQVSGNPLVP